MTAGEQALRSAAFGNAPGLGDREVMAAAAGSHRGEWLAAVVLGARGRYAAATTLLGPLVRGGDPLLAALAGATLAAHRRQLGGHAAALPLDGAAARLAMCARGRPDDDGIDPAGALADALLGLAADNLGLGRLAVARRLITRAAALPSGWRATVRAGWVRAEVELAAGLAADSISPAECAAGVARERGAVRHSIKSDLVLGAALAATGEPGNRRRAARLVEDALEAATRCGLGSLTWPARLLSAELTPSSVDWNRSRVTAELHSLLSATDPQGRRLAAESAWVPVPSDVDGLPAIPTSGRG